VGHVEIRPITVSHMANRATKTGNIKYRYYVKTHSSLYESFLGMVNNEIQGRVIGFVTYLVLKIIFKILRRNYFGRFCRVLTMVYNTQN
jgi:hypothetical protein